VSRKITLFLKILSPLFGVGGFIFYALFYSSYFLVTQVDIIGAQRISQEEIIKRSGIKPGVSMFSFFESRVGSELLKNPWLKEANISRELPGKVVIEIKEREPFCLLSGDDGIVYYMSRAGEILGEATPESGMDFPTITGVGSDALGVGLLEEAIAILRLSRESTQLNWDGVSEVNLSTLYGVTLLTSDGRRVEFGRGEIEDKWHRVEKIIAHAGEKNLSVDYINVVARDLGVVNFKF